jgi:SAM-dependent methyltransferase
MFFEDRYEPRESSALYANYRNNEYFAARHRWEPWYSRSINDGLGSDDDLAPRRSEFLRMVAKYSGNGELETVLDYGGDRGQLLAGAPGEKHYVFDISGVRAEPGIIQIDDPSELATLRFDLLCLCEVLEHVSAPQDTLSEVISLVRPGGLLFVTVPNREFPIADIPGGNWYRGYLNAILKSRVITIALDFWSTVWKVKFGRVPPLGFAKMHEHINFFDPASLRTILEHHRLSVLECNTFSAGRGIAALCRVPLENQ